MIRLFNSYHPGLVALIILIGSTQSCSEKSIPASFGEPKLLAGSVSTPISIEQNEGQTPDMGLQQYLYLGTGEYAEVPVLLFNFFSISRGNLNIFALNDSSSSGKRLFINGKMRLTIADSLESSSTVELLKIVSVAGDTVFKETDLNSQAFEMDDPELEITVISETEPVSLLYPDSVSRYALDFDLNNDYLNWVTDSANVQNGIYLGIRTKLPESALLKYHSRILTSQNVMPVLFMDYEREGGENAYEKDTLTAYFNCFENLSIVRTIPENFPVIPEGKSVIGNVIGKNTAVLFNIDLADFPPQTLIKDASLILNLDSPSESQGYRINVNGISGFDGEDGKYELTSVSGSDYTIQDSTVEISLKDYFQMLVTEDIDSLEGIRMSHSRSADPFKHTIFTPGSDSLRIKFVYAE